MAKRFGEHREMLSWIGLALVTVQHAELCLKRALGTVWANFDQFADLDPGEQIDALDAALENKTLGGLIHRLLDNAGMSESFLKVLAEFLADRNILAQELLGGASFKAASDRNKVIDCQSPASWSQVPRVSPPSWSHLIARVMEPPRRVG